ncbi:MAG: potassium channel family protein [Actinobacteria bacterium]|nr:potassium channel family protein [Actinomycetota bacterium]
MSAIDWLVTAAGLLLVAAALREVFHTLLHPSGIGQLTPAIFGMIWRAARRLGGRASALAGPVAVVSSIVTWTLMIVVGWALVYWPQMPGAFQVAEGIQASEQDDLLDAVYLSAVALSTLGFGDIVAEQTALRIALVIEALVGFALLSAAISWVLSIYPALMRRRALASRINALVTGDGDQARLVEGDPPCVLALVLHNLSEQLHTVGVDLVQYPSSYFFHGPAADLSLPPALWRLQHALVRDDVPPEAQPAATALRESLNAVGDTLRRGPFRLHANDAQAALQAYAADHER